MDIVPFPCSFRWLPSCFLHALVHGAWRLLAGNITFVILCKVLGSILGVLVGITIPWAYAIGDSRS